jgi:hypothetical protein
LLWREPAAKIRAGFKLFTTKGRTMRYKTLLACIAALWPVIVLAQTGTVDRPRPMDEIRTRVLRATDDEWRAIEPKLGALLAARGIYDELGGAPPEKPATPALEAVRKTAGQLLEAVLNRDAVRDVLDARRKAFLAARDAAIKELAARQDELRGVLTQAQECALVGAGFLEDGLCAERLRVRGAKWSIDDFRVLLGATDQEWRILQPRATAFVKAMLEAGQIIAPPDTQLPQEWMEGATHKALVALREAVPGSSATELAERRKAYGKARAAALDQVAKSEQALVVLVSSRMEATLVLCLSGFDARLHER